MTALRLYAEDHPHLTNKLSAKIRKRMAELSGHVASGISADWPDYKHRTGVIAGLNEALELCEQTEADLNARD